MLPNFHIPFSATAPVSLSMQHAHMHRNKTEHKLLLRCKAVKKLIIAEKLAIQIFERVNQFAWNSNVWH